MNGIARGDGTAAVLPDARRHGERQVEEDGWWVSRFRSSVLQGRNAALGVSARKRRSVKSGRARGGRHATFSSS